MNKYWCGRIGSFLIFSAVAAVLLVACGDDVTQPEVETTQGIQGVVEFWEGDFMPPNPTGTITPVSRELFVHELAYFHDVELVRIPPGYTFFRMLPTKLVAQGKSGSDGVFMIKTPPGIFSLVSLEDSLFYTNTGGGLGEVNPIEVRSGEFTDVNNHRLE